MLSKEAILQAIRALSDDEQEQLIHELTLMLPKLNRTHTIANIAQLAGIFANKLPPPDDAQVQQWLDEHRQAQTQISA